MQGTFITFEGGEAGGKTTQINRTAQRLQKKGFEVLLTREPGGTECGEMIREILLGGSAKQFGEKVEYLLFATARAKHVDSIIAPALEQGKIVLCDRFIDSSRVYQGYVGGLDMEFITKIEKLVVGRYFPELTLIFNLGAEQALARIQNRSHDRFEKESLQQHESRRLAFLQIAKQESQRCKIIDAEKDLESVSQEVDKIIDEHLEAKK